MMLLFVIAKLLCQHFMRQSNYPNILEMIDKKSDDSECDEVCASNILKTVTYNKEAPTHVFFYKTYFFNDVFLTFVYLGYKLLNCIITLGLLFSLNKMLNTAYTFWGIGILQDLVSGQDWKTSGHFPRVTYCTFGRRDEVYGQPMEHTVQCVLVSFWFILFEFTL